MASRAAHSRTAPLSIPSWTAIWTALNLWGVLVSAVSTTYVPTTILPLSNPWAWGNKSSNGVYILSPTDSSVDLLFLNISSTLEAGSLSPRTVTHGVPFLNGSSGAAFTASIDDNETLTVFAGDCSSSGNQAVWMYGPAISTSATGQAWMNYSAGESGSSSTASLGTPYFLGASLSFSATIEPVMSAPVTYAYGGMCPWSNSSASTWQASASYSNRMVKVSPSDSGSQTAYAIESAPSYDPPIAEAGFSFTALTPAISNRSGIVTQEISHVLLGGHTRNAFINISTAAIWSLPEEAWNTIFINSPAAGTYDDLELAIRQGTDSVIEPRSGHTAVLNEDGTSLVIMGGWVDNVTTAAKPQLVVLEMGDSLSEWRWSVPTTAQPSGSGIYGHGAVLLPGNVMMVYGGYSTSTGHSKRADSQTPMFLNLTSMSWGSQYTNPTTTSPGSTTNPGTSASSPANNNESNLPIKLGLGLGLGIGIPLSLLLIALAILFWRRRTRNRRERDEVVRSLSQDASRFLSIDNDDDMLEPRDYGSPFLPPAWNVTDARDWYTGGGDPYDLGSRSLRYESLRGTRSMPALPPTAMERTSPARSRGAARGLYLPTTGIGSGGGYEFGSSAGPGHKPTLSGGIHPIYEAEDEDGEITTRSPKHDRSETESDPFITPTTPPRGNHGTMYFPPPSRSSATPSPEQFPHPPRQNAEVTEWVTEVDAADALLTARISPHGTTTTTTTTPPRHGQQPSRLLPSRPNSLTLPPPAANDSSDEARTGSNLSDSAHSQFSFVRSSSVRVAKQEMQRANSSSSSSAHTYSTAKTTNANFVTLRDEGPSLLMGKRGRRTGVEDDEPSDLSPPGSPSKRKPTRGWLGSLRRVFSGSASESSRGTSPSRDNTTGEGSDYEPRLVGMGPGGRLLRRKQGRDAWVGADGHQDQEEDEWDVERAVEQRLVQIMFTVPKERLRVVNADDIEREEEEAVIVDPEDEYDDKGHHYHGHEEEKEAAGQQQAYEDLEKEVLLLTQTRSTSHEFPALTAVTSTEYGRTRRENRLSVPDRPRTPNSPASIHVSIHTAEAVTIERPRTKVLQMVESIETLSRSGSPAGSPSRSAREGEEK